MPSDPSLPRITILTPTWNRRHLLPRLYRSLVEQDSPPGTFDWLVVDDGSTDGTGEWLETLIPVAPFPIRVIRQENGGKHRALNRAAPELAAPWVLVVDSDDWLLPGAMQRIMADTASAGPEVLAIVAPLDLVGFEPRWFRLPGRAVTYAEWQTQRQVGDTSAITRTSVFLRAFPLPEYLEEKYIAIGLVWNRALRDGGVLLSNDRMVKAEYQLDGISARSLQLRTQNPLGAMTAYDAQLKAGRTGRMRARSLLNYHRFFWHAKRAGKNPNSYGLGTRSLWLLPGWLLYLRDLLELRNV